MMYKLFALVSLLSAIGFVLASPVAEPAPQGLPLLSSLPLVGGATGTDVPDDTGNSDPAGGAGGGAAAGGPLSSILGPSDPLAGLGI